MFTWVAIAGSIASSTILILINKKVMGEPYGFTYPTILTTFHFALGTILNWLMVKMHWYEAGSASAFRLWKQAFFGVACLILMNYNLKMNSVGFYQLSKLCNIPVVVVYKFLALKQTTPLKELGTLAILLVGLVVFSVNDVSFNLPGAIVAAFAVIATAMQQTGCQQIQKDFNISGTQLNHLVSPPQFVLGFLTSLVLESFGEKGIINHTFESTELLLILSTGLFAAGSNIFGFSLIGRAGPITYQVVGHVKTMMIFVFGTLLFPGGERESRDILMKKIFGICIAMVGVILYTVLQLQKKKEEKPKDAIPIVNSNDEENEILRGDEVFQEVTEEEEKL